MYLFSVVGTPNGGNMVFVAFSAWKRNTKEVGILETYSVHFVFKFCQTLQCSMALRKGHALLYLRGTTLDKSPREIQIPIIEGFVSPYPDGVFDTSFEITACLSA